MKILHIGKYFPPYAGGMENYLRDLMTDQARKGDKPEALVHNSDVTLISRQEAYLSCDQELPVTRAAVWARILFTPISPTFGCLLARLIRKRGPDVLHLHLPNVSAFWVLFLPRARQIPWVVQWHADVLASRHSLGLRLLYSIYRPFERAILRRASAVITSSLPYRESSLPLRDFQDKCHVIPLGLDPDKMPNMHGSVCREGSMPALRVLAVGRLTYYKGFEYLIRAVASCPDTEVHLVGSGEQGEKLKALAKELSQEERIVFHDHLSADQLAHQFYLCDCLCLPSIERTEAFGIVLLEAMYYGKATIVSRVPGSGMGWVVDDGVTGLHIAPENTQALVDSMHNLSRDRDKIVRLGKKGREKFDREFRIDICTKRVSGLYRQVLRQTRARPNHDN